MNMPTMRSRAVLLLLIVLLGLLPSFGVATQVGAQSVEDEPEVFATWTDNIVLMTYSHVLTDYYGDPEVYGNLYRSEVRELANHALELEELAKAYPEGHPTGVELEKRAAETSQVAATIALEYLDQAEERRGLRNRTLVQKLGNLIRREFRRAIGLVRTIIRNPGRAIRVLAEEYVKDYVKKALPGKLGQLNRWFDESIARPLSVGLVRTFGAEVGAVLQKRLDTWFLQQRDRVVVPLRKKLEEEGYLAKEEKPEGEKTEGETTGGEKTEGETTQGETPEDEEYEFEEPTDADYDEVAGEDDEGSDRPDEELSGPEAIEVPEEEEEVEEPEEVEVEEPEEEEPTEFVDFTWYWYSVEMCFEAEDSPFKWEIDLEHNLTTNIVSGTIRFHDCPGGGRAVYSVEGEYIPGNDFVDLTGTRTSSRGPMANRAKATQDFRVTIDNPPVPNLAQ